MGLRQDKMVLVCDRCFRACCWYGEFMCDGAVGAGTGVLPVQILKKLNREHHSFWTNEAFERVYGTKTPDFRGEPPLYRQVATGG